MSACIKKTSLGQQPPRARAHRCTTTTSAHAHRAKILAFQHSEPYSKVGRPLPSTNSRNHLDEYFPCKASKKVHPSTGAHLRVKSATSNYDTFFQYPSPNNRRRYRRHQGRSTSRRF